MRQATGLLPPYGCDREVPQPRSGAIHIRIALRPMVVQTFGRIGGRRGRLGMQADPKTGRAASLSDRGM